MYINEIVKYSNNDAYSDVYVLFAYYRTSRDGETTGNGEMGDKCNRVSVCVSRIHHLLFIIFTEI